MCRVLSSFPRKTSEERKILSGLPLLPITLLCPRWGTGPASSGPKLGQIGFSIRARLRKYVSHVDAYVCRSQYGGKHDSSQYLPPCRSYDSVRILPTSSCSPKRSRSAHRTGRRRQLLSIPERQRTGVLHSGSTTFSGN